MLSSNAGFNFVINFIKLIVWTPSELEGDYQMSGWWFDMKIRLRKFLLKKQYYRIKS